MNPFTQENITTGSYVFLLMGGIIAFAGAFVVYLDKKSILSSKKRKK